MATFNDFGTMLHNGANKNVAMKFVVYVPGTTSATTYKLSDLQASIVMKSIFKEDEEKNVVMYSDLDLMRSKDMYEPLNDLLPSVSKAGEMLSKQNVSTGVLIINRVNAEELAIGLTDLQTGVVAARLGINIEMNYFVSDNYLSVIYGSDWKPEFENEILGRGLFRRREKQKEKEEESKALPYTKKTMMKDVLTPHKIKSLLDKAIIGQDDVKEKLATAVYQQEMAVRYNALHKEDKNFVPMRRRNILMYGPSGSGKTAMLQKLAEIIDKPVVIYDTTKLTPAGYHGSSTDSILSELLDKADGDAEKAAHGIVYLDEWDKAFIGANGNKELSSFRGEAVTFELLRMMDGCDVKIEKDFDSITVNTENILFIVGGAFPNLDKIVMNRIAGEKEETVSAIGFMNETKKPERTETTTVPDATLEDLKIYGIPTELLGRISTICRLKPLGQEDLVNILLHAEKSPLREYTAMFKIHNVKLQVAEKTAEAIAAKSMDKGLGARGLVSVLESVLLPILYKVAGNRKRMVLQLRPECLTKGVIPVVTTNMKEMIC